MRMAANVRELGSSDRGYHLVHDVIQAVAYRLRVDSAWNGVLYEATAPGLLGRAGRSWNGERDPLYDWDTVTVNRDHSLTVRGDALGYALDARAGRLKMKDNYKAHQSLLRMVQASVMNSRQDLRYDPRDRRPEDAASDALDVGLSLDWAWDSGKAQHNTHDVISDCDLNKFTPRLTSSRVVDLVPYARTATHVFVSELAKAARQPRDVTHRELVGTHPTERWSQIADWLIKSNVQGLDVTTVAHANLRRELANIAHAKYLIVAGIPGRLADMPRSTSIQRVQFAAAHRDRGGREGLDALVRMNMHIKGTQVNWKERRSELDPVNDAAANLGVSPDQLRKFLDSQAGGAAPRDDAGRPTKQTHRGPGHETSGPTR
jgi:hypothetical protein